MTVSHTQDLFAQDACRRGWHIFPVEPMAKLPALNGRYRIMWYETATDKWDLLSSWWEANPEYNYGISCKKSGLLVVDCDTPKDNRPTHGADQFKDLTLAAGADWHETIDTYTVETPSLGIHLVYNWPTDVKASQRKLGPDLDVRTNAGDKGGGYVIGAGSYFKDEKIPHRSGWYHVTNPAPVKDVPRWLLEKVRARPPRRRLDAPTSLEKTGLDHFFDEYAGLRKAVREAAEGNRNEALNWAAHQMAKDGECEDVILRELLNVALLAGLTETEARRTIHSAWRAANRG